MRQIVLNSLQCLDCNDVITSHHQHDFVKCSCGNSFADGGTEYIRSGGKVKYLTVYADDDFELVRVSTERGGRGINGDESLTWTKICDMNDEWLEAVLDYGGAQWHLDIIRKEIEYRKNEKLL